MSSKRADDAGGGPLLALRQTLHPNLGDKPSLDVMRVFVVGARAEATLPPNVWDQITYLFPGVPFHIFLIGPEAAIPPDPRHPSKSESSEAAKGGQEEQSPFDGTGVSLHKNRIRKGNWGVPSRTMVVSETLTLTTLQCTYEQVHAQFEPFDPYTDIFFAFSPGFGFPSQIAAEEIARARHEAAEDERYFKAARETYNAGTTSVAEAAQPAPAPAPAPEGGSTPAAETPSPQFTSLTTAPIVQAQREWARAIGQILSTKCALVSTGFSPADVERDVLAFESVEGVKGEFDWLLTPGENVFASQQWAVGE